MSLAYFYGPREKVSGCEWIANNGFALGMTFCVVFWALIGLLLI